ncbi:MAG TPA: DoxX family protein [Gemmatimonadales bacterium]|nr:DoxX family protein [Gemmatimonadales bacterium]
MIDTLYAWGHLVGRVLFALIFITSGLGHFTHRAAMTGYAAARGAPWPSLTVPLTGVMSLLGGLSIALGWHRFIGAGLLFIFMLWTSYFIHHFWTETDPMTRMNERIHFLKDLALGGAALTLAYYGGGYWPLSIGG